MAVEVDIFGQPYVLRADADEDHVRRVAELVDSKMREVAAGSRTVSTMQIAVLAALDIASEFIQARAEAAAVNGEVDRRSEALIQLIDTGVPEVGTTSV